MPPYRKRYAKRSYGRSRSTSRRRRPMGGSFMKRAKTRAYANLRTGGLLAIERKFSDFSQSLLGLTNCGTGAASNGATSTFAPASINPSRYRSAVGGIFGGVSPGALNNVGIGDTGSDRDGRQIICDSLHLRGVIQINSQFDWTTSNVVPTVNIVLVLDTQTNGAIPSGGSIFVNPGDQTGVAIQTCGMPFVNLSNSKRFRILKHIRRMVVPPTITGSTLASNVPTHVAALGGFIWAMDVPLKGMKTNFVADLPIATVAGTGQATVASVGDNGIFLFAWVDNSADSCYIAFNSRFRFRG